jgi:hypothetical protein
VIRALKIAAWLLVLAASLLRPKSGERTCRRLGQTLSRVARRRVTCCIGMALLVLLVRAALLPLWPIPKPVIYDEFGYLLQADTFASGRLTNPPHKLWPFFESIYILQQPTYNAKFPPGQGLVMAVGQRLFDHAWFGVWLSAGVLMASLCWALQGWLHPVWAFLGAFFALPLCLFSYWMNSYWGGALAAIGGALVLGSYPRIVRRRKGSYAWLLGLGFVILANTRMYEGLLFAIPVLVLLSFHARSARVWAPVAVVVALGAAFILVYDHRVTGHAFRFPYIEHNRQYGYVPPFTFLPPNPEMTYRHASIFNLYHQWEYEHWERSRGWRLLVDRAKDWYIALSTIAGGPPFVLVLGAFLASTVRDRRIRLAMICIGMTVLGSLVQIVYYPHYAAPATAAIMIVLVQSFRHLRLYRLSTMPVGRFLSRAIPVTAFMLLLGSEGARLWRQETPEQTQPVNARRDKLEAGLRVRSLHRNVIIVRYTGNQSPHEEWVYNRADIDAAEVVWAHDMGALENRKLLEYFKDRSVWLLEPDRAPEQLKPYVEQ